MTICELNSYLIVTQKLFPWKLFFENYFKKNIFFSENLGGVKIVSWQFLSTNSSLGHIWFGLQKQWLSKDQMVGEW
jgi:hypothetical protein